MEKISTAKLAKAQHAALAARPYSNKLKEIIGQVASASAGFKHPLLEAHDQPRNVFVIVLTSDRGLCAAFNSNLIKKARVLIDELKAKGREIQYIVQGKKGIGAFKYLNLPITERLIGVSDKPAYARAESIADKLIAAYGKKEIDEVYLVYSSFKSGSVQAPRSEKILPLSDLKGDQSGTHSPQHGAASPGGARGDVKSGGAEYLFHPDPKTILAEVLPLVVKMALFTAMLENTASEHAARRVAMKNATDSADDMIKDLSRAYNRARQGKITQEIAEIVGGANAL